MQMVNKILKNIQHPSYQENTNLKLFWESSNLIKTGHIKITNDNNPGETEGRKFCESANRCSHHEC